MITDMGLVQRLERADTHHAVDYALVREQLWPDSNARVEQIGDGYAIFIGAQFPVNRTVGMGLHTSVSATDLEQIERFYTSFGLRAQIDLCPYADPSLASVLRDRCYGVKQFFNVHVRALDGDLPVADPHVHVRQLGSSDEELWLATVNEGFAGGALPDDIGSALARIAFNKPGVRCFVATLDDQPAGAGAMVIRDGVALLFSASTRVQSRKRGVQTALLAARLDAAARAGCDLVMVTTTPGSNSERNVQRVGFRVVYTKLTLIQQK